MHGDRTSVGTAAWVHEIAGQRPLFPHSWLAVGQSCMGFGSLVVAPHHDLDYADVRRRVPGDPPYLRLWSRMERSPELPTCCAKVDRSAAARRLARWGLLEAGSK